MVTRILGTAAVALLGLTTACDNDEAPGPCLRVAQCYGDGGGIAECAGAVRELGELPNHVDEAVSRTCAGEVLGGPPEECDAAELVALSTLLVCVGQE